MRCSSTSGGTRKLSISVLAARILHPSAAGWADMGIFYKETELQERGTCSSETRDFQSGNGVGSERGAVVPP